MIKYILKENPEKDRYFKVYEYFSSIVLISLLKRRLTCSLSIGNSLKQQDNFVYFFWFLLNSNTLIWNFTSPLDLKFSYDFIFFLKFS